MVTPSFAGLPPKVVAEADQMVFNFSTPFISSSGLLNDHHFIRIMVIGMTLEDLIISIPSQMAKYDQVRITDQSGKAVPAKITANKKQITIAFEQPVSPGRTLEVDISGVDTTEERDATLLYGVTAKRADIEGEIPVGTARIQVPSRG
jgi:hypothetical protein